MTTRNCENCRANYSTGKEYGNMWCKLPNLEVEFKGLCEFCNPSHYSYQVRHNLVPRNEQGIPLSTLNVPSNGYSK